MTTITGHEHRPQSRTDKTREILARRRRNLLLPILLLVAVSLVAVSALLYWSADSVNRRDAVAQEDLVRSIVQVRKDALRQLVLHFAWWHDAVGHTVTNSDAHPSQAELPAYLQRAFNVAAGWVVAPDGTVRSSFENGRVIAPQLAPVLPAGSAELVAAARDGQSIDQVPAAGFVLYQQDLALIGASLIAPLRDTQGGAEGEGNVLVFVQPMDLTLFARAGIGAHIDNLHFLRGAVPPGYLGCEIKGLDGKAIGSVVWRNQRSGDALLWSLAPLLLVALLAVCVLLVLAIKRVETVVTREGRLSISLYQEKQRRSQKSDFVSMISHELRTPLQAIRSGHAGALRRSDERGRAA